MNLKNIAKRLLYLLIVVVLFMLVKTPVINNMLNMGEIGTFSKSAILAATDGASLAIALFIIEYIDKKRKN